LWFCRTMRTSNPIAYGTRMAHDLSAPRLASSSKWSSSRRDSNPWSGTRNQGKFDRRSAPERWVPPETPPVGFSRPKCAQHFQRRDGVDGSLCRPFTDRIEGPTSRCCDRPVPRTGSVGSRSLPGPVG
jgi:hypothetical protein